MRFLRPILAVCLAVTSLTSCFTGERPSFAPVDPAVADPAIAAVIGKLDALTTAPLTAQYTLLTKYGNITTPATVVIDGPERRSVTIGTVRYLFDASGAQTCDLAAQTCAPAVNDALISNLSLTSAFFSSAPAARLRQDAGTSTGAPLASIQQLAQQPATCVTLAFAGGNKLYCALDNGLLALQDTPDLRIELTSIVNTADATLLVAPAPAGG